MTTANEVIAKAKEFKPRNPAFYTTSTYGFKVHLCKTDEVPAIGAKVLTGRMGGKDVCVMQSEDERGLCLSVVLKDTGEVMCHGRIVSGHRGMPKMLVTMPDDTVYWVDVTREADHEYLAALGLDIERMLQKQAKAQTDLRQKQEAKREKLERDAARAKLNRKEDALA